jgi:beta-N-acetylhexosaminidase
MRSRAIYGLAGKSLSPEELAFFRQVQPWGFILFARNIEDPGQVAALTTSLRDITGDARTPILIDQEGGRVARLKPPHWRIRPAGARFGEAYRVNAEAAREATYLNARLIAAELTDLGINVDCLPLLDVPQPGAHDIIGDRAFAADPSIVIDLGRTQIEGLLEGGVLPIMKHIPGHGRAGSDSHLELPRVATGPEELSAVDFVTFRSLDSCPMAMTAHVVYDSIDPQRPATTSPKVVRDVIRGEIGFDGLLMSDDLSMKALAGPLNARARAALFAGCDVVLHCNGDMDEMTEVASQVGILEGASLRRAEHAVSLLQPPKLPFDPAAAEARVNELLGASA